MKSQRMFSKHIVCTISFLLDKWLAMPIHTIGSSKKAPLSEEKHVFVTEVCISFKKIS